MQRLTIDADKCTACRACELTCAFVNEKAYVPSLSRIRVVRFMDRGINVPMACVHCAQPACVEACPTDAFFIDKKTRLVRINGEECVGCGECVMACPFGAVEMNEETGIAQSCDLCGGRPSCVESCIYGALTFRSPTYSPVHKRRIAAQRRFPATEG